MPTLLITKREQEVLELARDYLADKEIAQKLDISVWTVKFHISNLLAKFQVDRRAKLSLDYLRRTQ